MQKENLYVDLDGTFIKADMLFESLIVVIKSNPFIVLFFPFWLWRGRAYLKHQLSIRATIPSESLPLNSEFYDFLIEQKKSGRKIILATASIEKFAKDICLKYPIFDSYISSNATVNLKGREKLKKIQSMTDTFSYAGNSSEDFYLFAEAEESFLVNPTKKAKKLSLKTPPTKTFDDTSKSIMIWVKQLRMHQWLKNFLIFVPLLVSGLFMQLEYITLSVLGLISFSCLASATYIINDLLDLTSDRNHKRKKFRPLAAGQISIVNGIGVAVLLLGVALAIAIALQGEFIYVLCTYLIVTLAYSFKIKQYVGIDVITLASLYTIRILAGSIILDVPVSFWLLSFSMFVFLSLALVKRCAELKLFEQENKIYAKGRDYNVMDYGVLMNLGISSAMLSVLMFCFYVNSNILTNQYQEPTVLWLIVPALCYWLMRMWIKTHRGEMHDDPIVFSLKDRGSRITIGFIALTAILAQVL